MTSRGGGGGRAQAATKGKTTAPGGMQQTTDQFNKLTMAPTGAEFSSIIPAKTAPGTKGRTVTLKTNMWELQLPTNTPLFRYDVSVKGIVNEGRGKPRELAGGGKNDFFYLQRRDVCYHVFYRLAETNKEFEKFFAFTYDKAKILYSLQQLGTLKNPYSVNLDEGERQLLRLEDKVTSFEVTIQQCDLDFVCVLGKFEAAIDRDLRKKDRSPIQMLELATSQGIYYNLSHLSYGNTHFPKNAVEVNDRQLGRDRQMIRGISKNVRVIEGPKGSAPKAVMQLDIKTGVFWKEQMVIDLGSAVLNMRFNNNTDLAPFQRQKFNDILRDLVVETTYGQPRQFTVAGLSHKNANELMVRLDDGNEVSIAEYFAAKYNKRVNFGKLPCIKEFRQRDRSFNFYPMEYCRLMPGQRIEIMKQTEEQMKYVVPKSALRPADRWPEIERLAEESSIFSNDFLDQLGIQVAMQPMQVNGRVLDFPEIQCNLQGKMKQVRISARADWNPEQGTKFFYPGRVGKWVMMVIKNQDGSPPAPTEQLGQFAALFVKEASAKGMQIQNATKIDCIMEQQVEKYADHCKEQNIQFVMFVTRSKNNQALHDKVKQYFEEDCGILTQQLVVDRTIGKIMSRDRGWAQLLQNVLFKSNTKFGGLNYNINVPGILKKDRMFVSYDVSHPTHIKPSVREQVPSTVGMCSNAGRHPLMLTGNYGYQRMRREECGDILFHLFKGQLEIWMQYHDKKGPAELIVLRDGVSEGQYLKVIEQELPQLMAAFTDLGLKPPKVELFTVEKRHNARFMPAQINPNDKAPQQNVKPGTVIDQGVVHAQHDEFYLCSHVAIQGTAKIPRYGKLCDQIGLSKDELQEILYGLAFNHQIITTPVSLPATLYGAHELAKRGKNTRKARFGREDDSSVTSDSGVSSNGAAEENLFACKLGITTGMKYVKFWA